MDTTKIINFSYFPFLSEVIADPCGCIATAHWSKDVGSNTIKVCYGKGECTEVFTLEMPVLDTQYNYLADSGKYEVGITHLLHVALRGNRIVGFATNGTMVVWSLSQKQPVVSHELDQLALEKMVHSDHELFTHSKDKRHRSGSNIFLRFGSVGRIPSRESSPKRSESPRNKSDVKDSPKQPEIKIIKAHADHHEGDVI
jgi:hypothetical protein